MPWKSLIIEENVYIFKLNTNPCSLQISDFKEIWIETLSDEESKKRFKELNPLLCSTDVSKELQSIFDNSTVDNVTLERADNVITFKTSCSIDDFTLNFNWNLQKQSNEQFFKEVTLNLIHSIQLLETCQENLLSVIEKKDKEIEEYRREHGELTRESLKTVKFDKGQLQLPESNAILNVLSENSVIDNFNNKFKMVVPKRKSADDEKKIKKLKPYQPRFVKRKT